MEDLRGTWPCAWCDTERVGKRGTICAPCQLRLDHGRGTVADVAGPQLRLVNDEPAHPFRAWQDVTPRDEYL